MKKKVFSKVATFGLASALFIPSGVTFAETPSNNENIVEQSQEEVKNIKPSIEVFDKDGILIKSYSDEEIAALQNEIPSLPNFHSLAESTQKEAALYGIVYSFGKTTFYDSIWIGGGQNFVKPLSVILNPAQSNQKISVRVYDSSSSYIGQVTANGFSSETNIPISHLTKYDTLFKLKLQNISTYDAALSGGYIFN